MGKKNDNSGTFVVIRTLPDMATWVECLHLAICTALLRYIEFTKIIMLGNLTNEALLIVQNPRRSDKLLAKFAMLRQ